MIDQLRTAIQSKTVCKLKLAGEDSWRTVHPHGICVLSSGKTAVVCWQVSGFSQTGTLPGFRNLSFDRCELITLLDESFAIRPEFDPAQRMFRKWLVKVS